MDYREIFACIYVVLFGLIVIGILIYMCYQLRKLSKQKKIIEQIDNVFHEMVELMYIDLRFIESVNFDLYDTNCRCISMMLDDLLKEYEKYV